VYAFENLQAVLERQQGERVEREKKISGFWQESPGISDGREFHFESTALSFIAFYNGERIAAVLDTTADEAAPNHLLIVAPRAGENPVNPDTKWDTILKEDFGIDPNLLRPKENTKYQKLDISYGDLSLFDAFSVEPNEEMLEILVENRLNLALENAYRREEQYLLAHNRASLTITRAESGIELLNMRVSNLSRKALRESDDATKAEATAKLYLATEKLKRAQRRLKRAIKRAGATEADLAARRAQISRIKSLLSAQSREMKREEKVQNLTKKPVESVALQNADKNSLTIGNFGATNHVGDEKTLQKGSTIMAKDTKREAEFKPPYVDDTVSEQSSDIRFARKAAPADDRTKKIWMYAASVLVSIVLVFGVFYLLSGEEHGRESDKFATRESYESKPIETPYAPPRAVSVVEPAPVAVEKTAPIATKPAAAKSVSVKKAAPVVAKKTVARPAPKPMPAPVAESDDDEDETPLIAPEDEEEIAEAESTESADDEDDYSSIAAPETSAASLDDVRDRYVASVISGSKYSAALDGMKKTLESDNADTNLDQAREMNKLWNEFRNATYDAYYDGDGVLKSGINYEKYTEDEQLLRVYSDAHFEAFERVVNDYAATYEYANGLGLDLYEKLEEEVQDRGHPSAKLDLVMSMYNTIRMEGGRSAVLDSVQRKAEERKSTPLSEGNLEGELLLVEESVTIYQQGQGETTITSVPIGELADSELDDELAAVDEEDEDDAAEVALNSDSDDETSVDSDNDEDEPIIVDVAVVNEVDEDANSDEPVAEVAIVTDEEDGEDETAEASATETEEDDATDESESDVSEVPVAKEEDDDEEDVEIESVDEGGAYFDDEDDES
jgi:hypothetical protein